MIFDPVLEITFYVSPRLEQQQTRTNYYTSERLEATFNCSYTHLFGEFNKQMRMYAVKSQTHIVFVYSAE